MAIRDLIPCRRGREVTNPFLTLHHEMNRLFDDVFRRFGLAPFGARQLQWAGQASRSGRPTKRTACSL